MDRSLQQVRHDAYQTRRSNDRERLDTMMRYAQSAKCRSRLLHDYFDEPIEEDCGHCDNCEAHAAGQAAAGLHESACAAIEPQRVEQRAATARGRSGKRGTRTRASLMHDSCTVGQRVMHHKFGDGHVVSVADTHASVSFAGDVVRRIHRRYLQMGPAVEQSA